MTAVHDVLRYLLARVPHSTQDDHDRIAAVIDQDDPDVTAPADDPENTPPAEDPETTPPAKPVRGSKGGVGS